MIGNNTQTLIRAAGAIGLLALGALPAMAQTAPFERPLGGAHASGGGSSDSRVMMQQTDGDDTYEVSIHNDQVLAKVNGKEIPQDRVRRSGDKIEILGKDGGVLASFNYGTAQFHGAPDTPHPVVAMAASLTGQGYWIAAADGGVFAYGDAGFFGSPSAEALRAPVVGITATNDGAGYWVVAGDGGVFAYGSGGFFGAPVNG